MVHSGAMSLVAERLLYRLGIEAYTPHVLSPPTSRVPFPTPRPVFPGYLFVPTTIPHWQDATQVEGFIKFLTTSDGEVERIQPYIIDLLRLWEADGTFQEMFPPLYPHLHMSARIAYSKGSLVRIVCGPAQGRHGVVVRSIGADKVRIVVGSTRLVCPRTILTPA